MTMTETCMKISGKGSSVGWPVAACQNQKDAAKQQTGADGRQRYKQWFVRQAELKFHRVLAGRQVNAAHDEIAAQQFRRPAIHQHVPVRIELVIKQQYRGGGGF